MSGDLQVRVRVLEAWSDAVLSLPATTRVSDIKRQALLAMHIEEDPSRFLVKFRGAELRDESRSLADAGVPDDGAMIVMRSHRMPVR